MKDAAHKFELFAVEALLVHGGDDRCVGNGVNGFLNIYRDKGTQLCANDVALDDMFLYRCQAVV